MSEGSVITPDDLPFAPPPAAPNGRLVNIPDDLTDLKAAIREVTEQTERIIIARALDRASGNRTHAAEALGISRRALINKIKDYGLE